MMVAVFRAVWCGLAVAVLACCGASPVLAQCVPTVTTAGTTLPAYSPFVAPTNQVATVTARNAGAGVCTLQLAFLTPALPASMTGPGVPTLTYTIESATGAQTLVSTAATPAVANRITVVVPGATGGVAATTVVSVRVRAGAGQVVPQGSYVDTRVTARIFTTRANGTLRLRSTATFRVAATVLGVCQLSLPTTASMNFTADIVRGRPQGAAQTSDLVATCTAQTRVRLTAGALARAGAVAPVAGFDNFINLSATANLGGASVTHLTTGTAVTSSTSAAQSSGTSGTVGVSVNLINGQTVQAGGYSSVLTVSVDPSF